MIEREVSFKVAIPDSLLQFDLIKSAKSDAYSLNEKAVHELYRALYGWTMEIGRALGAISIGDNKLPFPSTLDPSGHTNRHSNGPRGAYSATWIVTQNKILLELKNNGNVAATAGELLSRIGYVDTATSRAKVAKALEILVNSKRIEMVKIGGGVTRFTLAQSSIVT